MVTRSRTYSKSIDENIQCCGAVVIDKNNIAECLQAGPNPCSFALPFGYAFLCQHPRVNEIVVKTKNNTNTKTS